MAKKDKRNVTTPTLNIWKATCTMKITIGSKKGNYQLNKNEFLFLIGEDGENFYFKDEDGNKLKIHKKLVEAGKIQKVF